jgi:site-specific DNA-methyltransferase (adenine-specific)
MLLLNGDCIEQMQKLIDEGVQVESVVTDPPYELGFMGKSWDASGIAFDKKTWELAFQLLKPGGHLLAFSASRNYHRMAVAVEDAGFEIRDQLMWIYGSGFPKSLNIGKAVDKELGNKRTDLGSNPNQRLNTPENDIYEAGIRGKEARITKGNTEWEGWGTALKPAHEPIVMARKPLEGTVVDNVLEHGVGGINIDECRVGLSEGDDPRLGGKGSWKTDKMAKDVYVGGYAGKETGSSELGRFPSNVMHDGLDEEWARFFYCPKTAKSERNQGLVEFDDKQYSHDGRKKSIENPYQRNKSISKNSHPTVKPVELMKYLCRLVTPKGGTVLDPFMGSGSTGMAAKDEGFNFIGIEREKEYFKISEQRIKTTAPLSEFFT